MFLLSPDPHAIGQSANETMKKQRSAADRGPDEERIGGPRVGTGPAKAAGAGTGCNSDAGCGNQQGERAAPSSEKDREVEREAVNRRMETMGSLILMAVALAAVSQPFAAAGIGLMAVAVHISRDV